MNIGKLILYLSMSLFNGLIFGGIALLVGFHPLLATAIAIFTFGCAFVAISVISMGSIEGD